MMTLYLDTDNNDSGPIPIKVGFLKGSGYQNRSAEEVFKLVRANLDWLKVPATIGPWPERNNDTVADIPQVAEWLAEGQGRPWCTECQNWVDEPTEWHQPQKWGFTEGTKCPAGHVLSSAIGGGWIEKHRQKLDNAESVRQERETDSGHHHFAP